MTDYRPFTVWAAVLMHARTQFNAEACNRRALWYHAPLDITPARVFAVKVFANGKIRLQAGDVRFTADKRHLDRFRWVLGR